MSPPAENARPAPVSTIDRASGSSARWAHTRASPSCSFAVTAFMASGRFIVTIRTGPRSSIKSSGAYVLSVMLRSSPQVRSFLGPADAPLEPPGHSSVEDLHSSLVRHHGRQCLSERRHWIEQPREEQAPPLVAVQWMLPRAAHGPKHLLTMACRGLTGAAGRRPRRGAHEAVTVDPRGPAHGTPGGHIYEDVGQPVLHGLEGSDRDTELVTLLHMGHRQVEHGVGNAQQLVGDGERADRDGRIPGSRFDRDATIDAAADAGH